MRNVPNAEEPAPHHLHEQRAAAESFGDDPARYDRTRARCPQEIINRLAVPGARVLDVGCGTGIIARQLSDAGCHVLGVEPDQRMADYARGTGIDVEVSTFENWSPQARSFDLVTAGSAWHWVEPLAGATKAADVLDHRGRLAPMWHAYHLPEGIAQARAAALRRVAPDRPLDEWSGPDRAAAYDRVFDAVADAITATGRYAPVERWEHTWPQTFTTQAWLDRMPTQADLLGLSALAALSVLDEVGAAIDALGGEFTMSARTVVITALRS